MWKKAPKDKDKILKKLTEKEIQDQLYGYIEKEEELFAREIPVDIERPQPAQENKQKFEEVELLSQDAPPNQEEKILAEEPQTTSHLPQKKGNIFRYQAPVKLFRRSVFFIIWALLFIIILIIAITYLSKIFSIKTTTPKSPTEQVVTKKPYTIQVAIYENSEDADSIVDSLNKKGFRAYIFKSISSKGKTHYRIYAGEFDTTQEAATTLDRLKTEENYQDAFVRFR